MYNYMYFPKNKRQIYNYIEITFDLELKDMLFIKATFQLLCHIWIDNETIALKKAKRNSSNYIWFGMETFAFVMITFRLTISHFTS